MGCNARNDEILENLERMRYDREAYEDALAIVRQFNSAAPALRTYLWRNSRARYLRLSIGRGGRI